MPGRRQTAAVDKRPENHRASILIQKALWVAAQKLLIEDKIPGARNFSAYMEQLLEDDLKKRRAI